MEEDFTSENEIN